MRGPSLVITEHALVMRKDAIMWDKERGFRELGAMLSDIFSAKAAGETYARLARAHGYVDGYMRALLEMGLATKRELLDLVNAERERASGPRLRAVEPEDDDIAAA